MNDVKDMMRSHPTPAEADLDILTTCIAACFACEQVCTACADACLAEEKVTELRHCIRTDLDCADVCAATGRILSRQTQPDWNLVQAQVQALAQAVEACGDECARHAEKHEHCRVCMEACRRCEQSCRALLQQISAQAAA